MQQEEDHHSHSSETKTSQTHSYAPEKYSSSSQANHYQRGEDH